MAVVVAVVVPTGGFIYHFVFDGGGQQWLAVSVGGCGDCGWMWRFLSTVIFFFSFFVSGGCGMGGGFWVGGW